MNQRYHSVQLYQSTEVLTAYHPFVPLQWKGWIILQIVCIPSLCLLREVIETYGLIYSLLNIQVQSGQKVQQFVPWMCAVNLCARGAQFKDNRNLSNCQILSFNNIRMSTTHMFNTEGMKRNQVPLRKFQTWKHRIETHTAPIVHNDVCRWGEIRKTKYLHWYPAVTKEPHLLWHVQF